MDKDLKYLIFHLNVNRLDGSMKPLFRFQSELANEIVKVSEVYTNPDSIRPYLNQILKYNGSNQGKPISAEMRKAIIEASKSRLNPEDDLFVNFEKEFDKAYSILSKNNELKKNTNEDEEEKYLREWQKNSNRMVVFNREPLEVKCIRNIESNQEEVVDSRQLIRDVLDNLLNNFKKTSNKSEKLKLGDICDIIESDINNIDIMDLGYNEQFFIRYYVSSFNIAKELWQSLILFIVEEITEAQKEAQKEYENVFELAIKIIELFNGTKFNKNTSKIDTTFLKVYKTDAYLTTVPTVYYECANGIYDEHDKKRSHEMLFTLILDKRGKKSISAVDGKDLEYWKEHIYYPLYWSDKNLFQTEEISLGRALPHIKRTIIK